MISKISKRGSTHDSNQDFMVIHESEDHIKGVLADGCSTGKHSELISRIACMTFKRGFEQPDMLSDQNVSSKFIMIKAHLDWLELSQEYGFTTVILFVYHKTTKTLRVRFFGDGCMCINGEFMEIDQENIPDYFIYHDDYADYLAKYPTQIYEDVEFFTISTDGLMSFSKNQFDVSLDSYDPIQFFVTPVLAFNMLERRYNILTRNGWKHSDDLTLISYANTEQSEQT